LYLPFFQPETLSRSATVRRAHNVLRPLRPSPMCPQRGAVGWAQGRPSYHPSTTPSKGNLFTTNRWSDYLGCFSPSRIYSNGRKSCECRIYEFLQRGCSRTCTSCSLILELCLRRESKTFFCFYNGVMCSIPHQGNILLAAFLRPLFLLDLHSKCSFFKYLNTWTCYLMKDGFARNQCLNTCSSPQLVKQENTHETLTVYTS